MKLDLGSGSTPKEGYEGVDFFAPGIQHQVNLFKFPWPWEDSSVDALHSAHFLEHLPMAFVTEDGSLALGPERPEDQDLLCRFMDECWRILKPDGEFHIIVPSGRSNRGFQDPTHRRFFVTESFWYFNAEWRKDRGLDHYFASCNFDVRAWPTISGVMMQLPANVQHIRISTEWNATIDMEAVLTARK